MSGHVENYKSYTDIHLPLRWQREMSLMLQPTEERLCYLNHTIVMLMHKPLFNKRFANENNVVNQYTMLLCPRLSIVNKDRGSDLQSLLSESVYAGCIVKPQGIFLIIRCSKN